MAKQYLVRWEMNIEADSRREAAKLALEYQRDPDSGCTWFSVAKIRENSLVISHGKFKEIDAE